MTIRNLPEAHGFVGPDESAPCTVPVCDGYWRCAAHKRVCTLCGMRRANGVHRVQVLPPLGRHARRSTYRASGYPGLAVNGLWRA